MPCIRFAMEEGAATTLVISILCFVLVVFPATHRLKIERVYRPDPPVSLERDFSPLWDNSSTHTEFKKHDTSDFCM